MITELKSTEFDIARPLFSDFEKYQLMLLSMFEGNKPGRIFVDDKNNPSSGLCYLGDVFFVFVGKSDNAEFNNELRGIIVKEIIPNYNAVFNDLLIYFDQGWDEILKGIFGHLALSEGVYYELNSNEKIEWEDTLLPEFTIELVDKEFLERKNYTIPEEIRIVRWLANMYGSLENYYQRGFSFSVVHKKKLVVSFWHCSYLSNDKSKCELGIHTKEEFRKKGLGKNIVFHMLNHCWKIGVKTAGWHTSNDNIASIKLAESVGYKFNRAYPIYFGYWPYEKEFHSNAL